MAKLKYNIRQKRFYKLAKSKSKFWTPDCNVCVFYVSLSGQKKVSSHVNRQIKSGTRMRAAKGRKKVRSEVCLVGQSYFHQIQDYWRRAEKRWRRKGGEWVVFGAAASFSPLPLIEKYISIQLRNKFLTNWEIYIHPNEKHISAQLGNIFLHKVYYCFFSRCR